MWIFTLHWCWFPRRVLNFVFLSISLISIQSIGMTAMACCIGLSERDFQRLHYGFVMPRFTGGFQIKPFAFAGCTAALVLMAFELCTPQRAVLCVLYMFNVGSCRAFIMMIYCLRSRYICCCARGHVLSLLICHRWLADAVPSVASNSSPVASRCLVWWFACLLLSDSSKSPWGALPRPRGLLVCPAN